MNSKEIRQSFIDFFKRKGHTFVPSAPVVPADDPTIMFTNAGMNQFKDLFLGTGERSYRRAVNSQKCIRVSGKHNDLEEVGVDTYHHTFFEMLGNWSFGDYYKEEAIQWAWELLTQVWKLPVDKLYATVFREDDEAEELWKQHTNIHPEQILRFDEKDNFWEMGDTGPCGPCSEIHMDLGKDACDMQHVEGHVCQVNGDCGRYIEIWNLVFIQFNRKEDGSLEELKNKHIDTGMGFERISAIIQNKTSNYDTDVFQPIINYVSKKSGIDYKNNPIPFRVIADHIRTLSFSIADGVIPSNDGRGYVIRRILRRASRYGKNLGFEKPFLFDLSSVVIKEMGDIYPELKEKSNYISEVIRAEEESFLQTLDQGISRFEELVKRDDVKAKQTIPGEEAFRLYDTYGFPIDLTMLMAREENFKVDMEGFEKALQEQRERGRAHSKGQDQLLKFIKDHSEKFPKSKFLGYNQHKATGKLLAILKDEQGKDIELLDILELNRLSEKSDAEGIKYWLLFDQTPFYGEGGGQVGDTGDILISKEQKFKVLDTQKREDRFFHFIDSQDLQKNLNTNPSIVLKLGSELELSIDSLRRLNIQANHSATHALQLALRKTLGEHIGQAGSVVEANRLRFDFTHHKALSEEEIVQIEDIVNRLIQDHHDLDIREMGLQEAKENGAMAFFGDKYGEIVRTIRFADSFELCGGTHVKNTVEIVAFKIIKESSPGAGVRRIEAVAGHAAVDYLMEQSRVLNKISRSMGQPTERLEDSILQLQNKLKESKKSNKDKLDSVQSDVETLEKSAETVGVFEVISHIFSNGVDQETMGELADRFRQQKDNRVVLFASKNGDKAQLLFAASKKLTPTQVDCNVLVKAVSSIIKGGGGGRPDFVQAGGKDSSQLDKALQRAKEKLLSL